MPTTTPKHRDEASSHTATGTATDDTLTDPLSSAAVISSSGETEISHDGLFTQQLVSLLDGGSSLDEAMDEMARDELTAKKPDGTTASQAPAIVRLGKGGPSEDSGKKKAVLIGNKNYAASKEGGKMNIPTAKTDAKSLAGSLSGQDYTTETAFDQTAKSMGSLYTGAVNDSELTAGDSVVLYFSGHGTPLGPVGVGGTHKGFHEAADPAIYEGGPVPNLTGEYEQSTDQVQALLDADTSDKPARDEARIMEHDAADILPNSTFTSLVSTASAKGLHLRIILDACFSGRTTDMVRDQYLSSVAEGAADGSTLADGSDIALELNTWKDTLITWRRAQTLDSDSSVGTWKSDAFPVVKALIERFAALTGAAIPVPEANLDLVKDIAKLHKQIDDALNAMIAALQRVRDGEED